LLLGRTGIRKDLHKTNKTKQNKTKQNKQINQPNKSSLFFCFCFCFFVFVFV